MKLALQIRVVWGDVVLDVVHVEPLRTVRFEDLPRVGEGVGRDVLAEVAGEGGGVRLMGGALLPLTAGARARVTRGALALDVCVVEAVGRVVRSTPDVEGRVLGHAAGSLLMHLGALAALALFVPGLARADDDEVERDRVLLMQKYLDAAAMREMVDPPPPDVLGDDPRSDHGDLPMPGGTGSQSRGEEGTMGNPNLRSTNARFAVHEQGDPDPHVARQAALREATSFGAAGLLATFTGADARTTMASWGEEDASGHDALDARGSMWGDAPGEARGLGGLGLSGLGEGGGGRAEGIGLGTFGRLGHGIGTGKGTGIGPGHMVGSPGIREGATSVNGRLPPEAIQRIVRQSFGRFRFCYQKGLRKNPALEGRVTVKFLVDRSGAVATSADGGSSLPDPGVVDCVVRAFDNLSFPAPEGGMVTVVYPIVLVPGT